MYPLYIFSLLFENNPYYPTSIIPNLVLFDLYEIEKLIKTS